MNFWQKYQKIILAVAFILFCLLIGYLIYVLFFKSITTRLSPGEGEITPPASGTLPESDPGTSIPGIGDEREFLESGFFPETAASEIAIGGLTKTEKLSEQASLKPTLGANGSDLQYYDKNDGKFYRINKDGETELLSDRVFHKVENIVWAGTKDKAIIEYPDGANILYNFNTQKQITLPAHWKNFDFSPDSKNIVMKSIGIDPNNRWLAVSSDDGETVRALEPLGTKDETVYPAWSPNNQVAALFTESRGLDRQEVYFVGLNKENFKSTVVEGRGFQPKWSPEGQKLLYSVYGGDSNLKPSLWIVNASGNEIGSARKKLNIETWAEKCIFADNENIYCAVPENLPEGAGLFPELAHNTKDNIYAINAVSGSKKLIAIPDGNFNISDLIISENGYYLYFSDKSDNGIHKIRLK